MGRAIWVDEGNDADYTKLRAYGITAPYYSIRDPRVTRGYLKTVQSLGFTPGVYAAWNWYASPNGGALAGAAFATQVSQQLDTIMEGVASPPDFPLVQLDIETHALPYIFGALDQWRKHRPKRVTSWCLEGYQGGLFSPADAIHIAAKVNEVVPSAYAGDMTPFDAVDVFRNLVSHSFPPGIVSMFYDAAHLPAAWAGYAFTQGRLP